MMNPRPLRSAHIALALVLSAGLSGCLDHTLPPTEEGAPPGPFIALQRDFDGFERWHSFELTSDEAHLGDDRPRAIYINSLPAPSARSFPVGTVIVKVLGADDPQQPPVIHAMSKRGTGFNASGAVGWEWFELRVDQDTGIPLILWRGELPPDGEGYGLPGGVEIQEQDCNDCHTVDQNDAVLAAPLKLEDF